MGQINLEKNAETIVDNVPVFINGTYVGDYCLANLFSKWGNEDGDNLLMCEIAHRVIDIIEEKAKVEIHRCWGIHNDAGIFEISKNGKIIWKNEYDLEDTWDDRVYRKIWKSLPKEVREVIKKIHEEGIKLEF